MIFPKPSWRSGTSLFELFAFILVRIHKDTEPSTNFADYMQAWSRINATIAPYFSNLPNLLYNKQYSKLTSARHFVIGRPIRLDASGIFPEILRKTSEGKKEYYGTYKRTPQSNMASMGPKVVKQLSFFQKIKYAFTNWYIYACGYRQLGKLFLVYDQSVLTKLDTCVRL